MTTFAEHAAILIPSPPLTPFCAQCQATEMVQQLSGLTLWLRGYLLLKAQGMQSCQDGGVRFSAALGNPTLNAKAKNFLDPGLRS